jgi:hypothetical protein
MTPIVIFVVVLVFPLDAPHRKFSQIGEGMAEVQVAEIMAPDLPAEGKWQTQLPKIDGEQRPTEKGPFCQWVLLREGIVIEVFFNEEDRVLRKELRNADERPSLRSSEHC